MRSGDKDIHGGAFDIGQEVQLPSGVLARIVRYLDMDEALVRTYPKAGDSCEFSIRDIHLRLPVPMRAALGLTDRAPRLVRNARG